MYRGTHGQLFVSTNIFLGGLNHLRYSDLISVKTRDFFGETLPQTFVARGLITSYSEFLRLGGTNMSFRADVK